MQTLLDTLVIGAGQAALAAGYHLQRAGQTFTLLEAGNAVGGAWPHYYQSLRLFSPARFSALPGLPFPGDPEHYPTRNEVITYLRHYADHLQLPVVTGARVTAIKRSKDLFTVETAEKGSFQARSLIAATGSFQQPNLPMLPGQERFGGATLHSFAYHSPELFTGQRVVVVGAGNSAVQIAVELAKVAQVTLATREPVRFMNQRPGGRDIHFWLWLTRLDRVPLDSLLGAWFAHKINGQGVGVLDTGAYQAALAAGKPDRRLMFTHFTADGVVWGDGSIEKVDTVIYATGYRPNLGYLQGLGALDAAGQAIQRHGISQTVPGLYFLGISNQRAYASATLRGVGADAEVVVRHLRRYLKSTKTVGCARSAWRCCLARSCCETGNFR